MGKVTVKHEECLEKIAQVMSEKSDCAVTVEDIRLEISRPTTSIYTAVVPNCASAFGNTCIVCTVRKWKKPWEYLVQTS